jgi:hypothetical protein
MFVQTKFVFAHHDDIVCFQILICRRVCTDEVATFKPSLVREGGPRSGG